MQPGATLIVSGFYQADIPLLQQKAESLGMILTGTRSDDDWACLTFKKNITQ
jgi:ribosomal protein L11 methyltransferase